MELRLIRIEYISCQRRANLSYSQYKCMIGKTMFYSFKNYIECLLYTSTMPDLQVIYEYAVVNKINFIEYIWYVILSKFKVDSVSHFYYKMIAVVVIFITLYNYSIISLSIFIIPCIRSLRLIYYLLQVCSTEHHQSYPTPMSW